MQTAGKLYARNRASTHKLMTKLTEHNPIHCRPRQARTRPLRVQHRHSHISSSEYRGGHFWHEYQRHSQSRSGPVALLGSRCAAICCDHNRQFVMAWGARQCLVWLSWLLDSKTRPRIKSSRRTKSYSPIQARRREHIGSKTCTHFYC